MLTEPLKAIAKAYANKCLDPNGKSKALHCGACRRECEKLRRQAEQGGALDIAQAFATGAMTMGRKAMQDRGAKLRAKLKL